MSFIWRAIIISAGMPPNTSGSNRFKAVGSIYGQIPRNCGGNVHGSGEIEHDLGDLTMEMVNHNCA